MTTNLLADFYTELSSTYSEENNVEFNCTILLNPLHPVYRGHFEGLPVAPGVCLTQVIKELLMNKLKRAMLLQSADNIKFLALINPNETAQFVITFSLRYQETTVTVSANYSHNNITYLKFKGTFTLL